ncbi:MAG TPA: transglutaminase domain-containing protein [Herpetosiphonaceae bacterium]|nr:transglutaminase domain-containing protein [Herpetosiphonaceae bacterium]
MTLQQRLRGYFTPGLGMLTWFLATLMTAFVVTNVVESEWVRGFEPMQNVVFFGCIAGALLGRWRAMPTLVAHVLAVALGLLWSIWRLQLDPRLDTFGDRFTDVLIHAIVAVRDLKNNVSPKDYYLFSLGGLLAAWLLGYATLWLIFRRGWVWRAVLLNGGLIMFNLTYALPKSKPSFWFFLVAALILIVFETFRARQQRWTEGALEQQEWLSLRYLWAGLIACFLLVIAAGLLPASISNAQLRLLGERLSKPIDVVQGWLGIKGSGGESVGAPAAAPNRATFANNAVSLGGSRVATNAVVLEVRSGKAEYWRSNAWDFYNGRGWENTTGALAQQALRTPTKREALSSVGIDNQLLQLDTVARQPLTQTITLRQDRGDQQLPAATTPLTWSLPVLVQHSFIISEGARPLPNFTDSSIYFNQGPALADLTYTVVSLVSVADKQSLREANNDYPAWVQRYLQLPDSPAIRRISALSRQITEAAGADNGFDKAVALEKYLRSLPYDDQIPPPPPDADPIENFLFNLKRGYCDYFSGAMILMLRAQGIPARWVQGYATGEFDPERGVYVVRDTIAHSWPEVYFIGYGWQRFEPTPAGYVTVPVRLEQPPNTAADPDEDIGPNGGIVNPVPSQPDFEELDSIRDALENQAPAPTPITSGLPPEEGAPAPEPASPWLKLLVWLVGLVGLAGLGGWLFFQRELRGLRPAARAYATVGRLAGWAGIEQPPARTPSEYVADLSRQLPGQKDAIRRLAEAYTREQYSASGRIDPAQVREDAREIARPLAPRALRRGWRILASTLLRQTKRRKK